MLLSSRPEVAIPTYPTPFLRLSARLTYSISPDSIAPLPQCFKAAKRSIGIPVRRLLAGHTQKQRLWIFEHSGTFSVKMSSYRGLSVLVHMISDARFSPVEIKCSMNST